MVSFQKYGLYGHRSPQGLAIHPETGDLWETEHGPQGGDELNRIEPGNNYGWPVLVYECKLWVQLEAQFMKVSDEMK